MSIVPQVSGGRSEDWLVIAIVLAAFYFVVYPFYLLSIRAAHTRRIKRQLVTSLYKVPKKLTPAEFNLIFSTKCRRPQLYATLLDLANRSVVLLNKKDGEVYVSAGPKLDDDLNRFERLLLHSVGSSETNINRVLVGFSHFKPKTGKQINGSRQYIFWWLLREDMRDKKYIKRNMVPTYVRMMLVFSLGISLLLSLLPLFTLRVLQAVEEGRIDSLDVWFHATNALLMWVLFIPVLLVVGFALLRLRGRMLGREWLLTNAFDHFIKQLAAFREFTRLTHRKRLRFESKELEKEALDVTRPYAIALGYVRE